MSLGLFPVYMRISPCVCLRILMHSAISLLVCLLLLVIFVSQTLQPPKMAFFLMYQILARGDISKRWYLDFFKLVWNMRFLPYGMILWSLKLHNSNIEKIFRGWHFPVYQTVCLVRMFLISEVWRNLFVGPWHGISDEEPGAAGTMAPAPSSSPWVMSLFS